MLITLSEYERIYGVIHSILKSENANTNTACSLYNTFGAYILSEHYKLPTKVYSGFAVFHLGGENVLAFGKMKEGQITSSPEEFHTWIEVDGWFIDFMAPEFPNVMKQQGVNNYIPRKMMQKKIDVMKNDLDFILSEGDFTTIPNKYVTESVMANIESNPVYVDLIEICSRWYNRKSKKMHKSIGVSDGKGRIKQVSLSYGSSLVGAW